MSITRQCKLLGIPPGRDRVRRLMSLMGIKPIYPKPRLSIPGMGGDKNQPLPLFSAGLVDKRAHLLSCKWRTLSVPIHEQL